MKDIIEYKVMIQSVDEEEQEHFDEEEAEED
jgi:hypothetical protein